MQNKLIFLVAFALLISSCAINKIDDPLIIPPNFNEVPDLKNPDQTTPAINNKDAEELKDLLLKKQ